MQQGRKDRRMDERLKGATRPKSICSEKRLRPLAFMQSFANLTSFCWDGRRDKWTDYESDRDGRMDAQVKQRAGTKQKRQLRKEFCSAKRRKTQEDLRFTFVRRPLLVIFVLSSVCPWVRLYCVMQELIGNFFVSIGRGPSTWSAQRRRPESSKIVPPKPAAKATGGGGIVSRCNNLHTYALFDFLYIYIYVIQACLHICL